jgi:putative ABC transport system permease protein
MFWRVLRRSVFANRGRLFVILLALGAGAAITAALLNLQVDAKRRITGEFRVFGANIVVVPSFHSESVQSSTFPGGEDLMKRIRAQAYPGTPIVPFLYLVAGASRINGTAGVAGEKQIRSVIVGTKLKDVRMVASSAFPMAINGGLASHALDKQCLVGARIARNLGIGQGDSLELTYEDRAERVQVLNIVSAGSAEDDQIFVDLGLAQRISGKVNELSLVQISYAGTPAEVHRFLSKLTAQLPNAEVRPVRQFTESEARLYGQISRILTVTVAVVLVLTALCVMAAMTNVAMERKNDVGLMKAIGGSVRRVLRLFMAEAALLGLAGGMIGAAVGMVISVGLGKTVFGVAARPRLIVYPISVALTVMVAILAAFPLRRLVHIRPASVFRGEE